MCESALASEGFPTLYASSTDKTQETIYVPWSKLPILGMVIQPLIGNPYNGAL